MDKHQKQIVSEIVGAMEQGLAPWTRPWHVGLARNLKSNRPYSGGNEVYLNLCFQALHLKTNQWATESQANSLGYTVRKNARWAYVRWVKYPTAAELRDDPRAPLVARTFHVTSAENLRGWKPQSRMASMGRNAVNAEKWLKAIPAKRQVGGSSAHYAVREDTVRLPDRTQFETPTGYLNTLAHELVHWTGKKERTGRHEAVAKMFETGQEAYAFEELVAEVGASFVLAELGVSSTLQSAQYLQHWAKSFTDKPALFFRACAMASKAHKFLQTQHPGYKDPKMVRAGKKAWATRRKSAQVCANILPNVALCVEQRATRLY